MNPLCLGNGPSVLGTDRLSLVQRDAGFEVSDFHAAFTPGAILQPTSHFRPLGPIDVLAAGSIDVRHALAVFDPLALNPDETVNTFERAVPAGRHDVFLARVNGAVVASLVRFKDAPVAHWVPALFMGSDGICPKPPFLPMFYTRFSVSYADEDLALGTELPAAARRALEQIRENKVAASDGFVAWDVGGVGQYASWFGEDETGGLVALATEYGSLRQPSTATSRIAVDLVREKRVVLREHDAAVSAFQLGEAFMIKLEFGPLATFERVGLETKGGELVQPARMTQDRHELRFEFALLPASTDLVRVDFQSVSQPRLHLDAGSLARKIAGWRTRGLIAVDGDKIAALAQRFCQEPADEIRAWLAEQDEVDELFF